MSSFKDDMNATDEIRRFAAQRMEFTRSPKKAHVSRLRLYVVLIAG